MFVSKSFFGVILHLGVSNFFKSQCQSLKSGSRSLAVSNSPFYTPSFALFLFSISRLAFFMSEIIVILNTCSDSQKSCCVNYTTEHQRKLKKYVFTLIFCWITFIIARSSCHESETSRMLSAFPSLFCMLVSCEGSYAGQ